MPAARLRSGPLEPTLDVVTDWLVRYRPHVEGDPVIEASQTMDPRDLARSAVLETWRRDRAQDWIEATGGSMLPLIRPGDRLLVRFGETAVRRGDVIVFRHDGLIVAHRVVGSRQRDGERRLIAKGDNEPRATEDVRPADLLGVVRAVDRGSGRRLVAGPRWGHRWRDGPHLPNERIPGPSERPPLVGIHEPAHRGGRIRGPFRALPLDPIPRIVEEGRIPDERR